MTRTAILILNFNGRDHLEACLSSTLYATGTQGQVYLVDNCSTDGSRSYVQKHFPSVKLILFNRNLGFAGAYNKAVEHVDEDVIVFLNNDVEVDKDWLTKLIEPLQSTAVENLAICGSKLLLFLDRGRVNHDGGALLPIGGGIDMDFLRMDTGSARSRFVGCACGASMAMRRSTFLELGGFDEDFFAYFEDTDLCWRTWLAGYRILLVPESRVYHKLGASWGAILNSERVYLGERNRLQCLLKNLELHNVFLGLFVSSFYSVLRTIRFLRFGTAKPVFASIRAYWWVLRNLQRIMVKRRTVQQHRVVPDSFLLKHGLMTSYIAGLREFRRMASDRRQYADKFSAGRASIADSSFSEADQSSWAVKQLGCLECQESKVRRSDYHIDIHMSNRP